MAMLALKPKPPRLRLDPNEELFPEVAHIQGRITCRVCETEEMVDLGHPALLCSRCLSNLGAAARRIADEYASAMAAFFRAGEELAEKARGNAWYAKTEEARVSVDPATFQRAWASAKASGGDKAQLCALRDALDDAAEAMRQAELRYIAAAPELEAARLATGELCDV